MKNKEYINRIIEKTILFKLNVFGAINIVGPKWCGKTTTAEYFAKSAIKFQSDPNKEGLKETAKINPSVLLNGEKPRLIDEWQEASEIWDAVRVYCDDTHEKGNFILTGSTSKKVKTSHTGTGRISKVKMYPMSLYETNESNGKVSLMDIFDNKVNLNDIISDLTIEDLIYAACRGGWPDTLFLNKEEEQLAVAKDYFEDIYERDMFNVDDVKRNKITMKRLLISYARNISTLVNSSKIIEDINGSNSISNDTLNDYIDVLEDLFVIDDLYGWSPSIRSKDAIRSGRKREFCDPSLVVAALNLSLEKLNQDLLTFGFIFETLCIRDLRVYSSFLNGEVSYYHDKTGLESDAVLNLNDGRYALIEFKLGSNGVEEGAKHLNELERLLIKSGKERTPDAKIVITGTKYGYKREDGVFVIPIGCLKP